MLFLILEIILYDLLKNTENCLSFKYTGFMNGGLGFKKSRRVNNNATATMGNENKF